MSSETKQVLKMLVEASARIEAAIRLLDGGPRQVRHDPPPVEPPDRTQELPRRQPASSFPDLELVKPLPWPAGREPLGFRHRNPANIRTSSSKWRGKVRCPSGETSGYECFKTHGYGYRAMLVLLMNYYNRHGLHSVKEIISRWAPHQENPTKAYIEQVAATVDIDPKADLLFDDLTDGPGNLYLVSRGIIRQELGGVPYTPSSMYNIVLKVLQGRKR